VCGTTHVAEQKATGKTFAFHSDQGGIEYASSNFRKLLKGSGITQSMSHTSNPYDNAHMESFLKSLKSEVIQGKRFA
jgi:transposase InsO family protein